MKIRAGDDLVVRGTDDGADRLVQFAEGRAQWEFPEPDDEAGVAEDEDDEEDIEEELREDERGPWNASFPRTARRCAVGAIAAARCCSVPAALVAAKRGASS